MGRPLEDAAGRSGRVSVGKGAATQLQQLARPLCPRAQRRLIFYEQALTPSRAAPAWGFPVAIAGSGWRARRGDPWRAPPWHQQHSEKGQYGTRNSGCQRARHTAWCCVREGNRVRASHLWNSRRAPPCQLPCTRSRSFCSWDGSRRPARVRRVARPSHGHCAERVACALCATSQALLTHTS